MKRDGMMKGDRPELRIGIVEDDATIRQALGVLVDGTPGYRCVGRWGAVEEALHRAPSESPDVILLDIDLPGIPGSEGVVPLRERFPDATVVMLTVYDQEPQVFTSICNGASGYLLKSTPPARLLEAIEEAADGGAPLSPEVAGKVLRLFRKLRPEPPPERDLTPRERQLLGLLAAGHSYQSAGHEMTISVNTVRNLVRSTYDKLHASSKGEAVSRALRAGLL